MANEKNLIPMDQRSQSEARELGREGGKASGAARRRKRSLKEAADLPVTDCRRWNKIAKMNVAPEDIDNQMAMIIGLTMAATDGDARAAKVIVDLLGDNKGNAVDEVEDDPITRSLKEETENGLL